jgi:F-type H+-transporting ATPase subunit b
MRRLHLAGIALLLMAAGPEKEGMPQLNFKTPLTVSQVVWGAIIFVLLYLLLSRWALPKVGSVLVDRRTRIASDLDTARASKSDADAAVAELTEATRRARAEAQASLAAATQQAKAEAAARNAVINEKLDAQLTEAEGRIAVARTAAMGALREVASDAAAAVVLRLTGHAPDPAQVDRAVGGLLPAPVQS